MNDNARKILSKAINKSVDAVTDTLEIREQLKKEMESNMLSMGEIEKEVDNQNQRRIVKHR